MYTSDFKKAIKILEKVNTSTMPKILDSVYYNPNNNDVRLIRTNLDQTIKVSIPKTYKEELGIRVIPMKTIDMLKNLKEDEFTITDSAIVTEKKNIVYKNLYSEEYPELHTRDIIEPLFEVTEKELSDMLTVKFAMSDDDARPTLKGLCFDRNKVIACDGYRLSIKSGNYESQINNIIISDNSIKLLNKMLDSKSDSIVKVYGQFLSNNEQFIKFVFSNDGLEYEFITKNVPGEYLKYKDVVPQDFENCITVNAKSLLDELEFAYKAKESGQLGIVCISVNKLKNNITLNSIITESVYDKEASRKKTEEEQEAADRRYNAKIREINNGKIKTKTKIPKREKVKEIKVYKQEIINEVKSNLDADITGNDLNMKFNIQYLYEAIKHNQDKDFITLKTNGETAPMVITADDGENLELILPLRK